MNQKLCLASCFLPLDADNCRWWLRLQDELLAQGMELVLISSAPASDLRLRTIVVPLWLQGYREAYAPQLAAITLEEPLALALAKRDRTWTRQEDKDLSEFIAGLGVCQQVWRTLLNELAPSVVLVWGSSLPQSVVLQQIALQQGRPCWVLERGLMPETLMLEMCGQGGCSELNLSFTVSQAIRSSGGTDLFAAAQSTYKKNRTSKYSQAGISDPTAFRQRFNPDGRKIIALLLQHDGASAMTPDDYLGARIHAPEIPSSTAAIQALSEVVAQNPGCRLIVKPHPMDQDDYSRWGNSQVTVSREASLHTLIEAADVVACQASSTQFEALLYEKPILLLAHSPLAGKGVAYEPGPGQGLARTLQDALERQNFDRRMTAGRRFIHFLLSNFSVALTDHSHAVPKLCHLAAFLGQNAVPTDACQTVNERLNQVGKWLNLWEKDKKSARDLVAFPASCRSGQNQERKQPANMNYKSHIGQDAWVAECLNFKRDGFFLDFGAFDGITISNTYALEKDLGWRGICVEPNPRYYPQVCEHRSCITVNVALWHASREVLSFLDAHGLSAIESFKDGDSNADRRAQATKGVIQVDTLNPTELLDRFHAPVLIDFLSLDVEGAEYDVLSSLDLKKYSIALMAIEHNHDTRRQSQIRDYLAQFGYEVVQNRNDDFFFHRGHLARLTGKDIDPLVVFQRVYDTFPIFDTAKKPQPARPAATESPAPAPVITSPVIFNAQAATPDSLRQLGLELCQKNCWQEASQVFNALTNSHPDDIVGWLGQITCARKQGHVVLAKLIHTEVLARHPEWAGRLSEKDVTVLVAA